MSLAVEPRPSTVVSPELERAEPAPAAGFYHPELDGLRFFAFLAVFLFHAFPFQVPAKLSASPVAQEIILWLVSLFQAGKLGVDLFFVLSSYLITELLLREHARAQTIDVGAFYLRRALRIWPLYFAFLGFILLCEPSLLGFPRMSAGYAIPFACFLGNWSIVWMGVPPATAAALLWTVSIEEQFYLVWPLVVRWITPARMVWACLGLLAIGTATRVYLIASGGTYIDLNFNSFVRLDSIAAGALLALALQNGIPRIANEWRALLVIGGLVAAVAGTRYLRVADAGPWAELVTYPLWSAAAVAILLGVLRPEGESDGVCSWSPIVYLGKISFGLYVLHYLAIFLVAKWGIAGGTLINALAALALTTALAALSYHLLERPFLLLKERFATIPSRPVDGALQGG